MSRNRLFMLLAAVVLLLAASALVAYAAILSVSSVAFTNPDNDDNRWVATLTVTTDATGNGVCFRYGLADPPAGALSRCAKINDTTFTCAASPLAASTTYYWQVINFSGNSCNSQPVANGTREGQFTISPLAVDLAHFSARREGSRVRVTWETVSETDNAGFKVYRSATESSERALLTFIPAQTPGATDGASYAYTDATAIDPNAVYWLEDIDLSGRATLHGPLAPELGVPNAVAARSLNAAPITPNVPLYVAVLFALASGLWAAVYGMGRKRA
jgi:hypothetical protein